MERKAKKDEDGDEDGGERRDGRNRSGLCAIEANNRGEGRFRNDQPASTTAWIRMGWGQQRIDMTECSGESRRGGGAAHKTGWRGWGRGVRNGDSRESVVRLL